MIRHRLTWRGDDVVADVERATRLALTETAAACVAVAQVNAPVDTGFMKNTLEHGEVREVAVGTYSIQWGNSTADYTLWQEIGSNGRPGRYFLRGAADAEYPKLAGRLQGHL